MNIDCGPLLDKVIDTESPVRSMTPEVTTHNREELFRMLYEELARARIRDTQEAIAPRFARPVRPRTRRTVPRWPVRLVHRNR